MVTLANDTDRRLYEALVRVHLEVLLPGEGRGGAQPPEDHAVSRLVTLASMLAMSDDHREKVLAYDIATRLLETVQPSRPGIVPVVEMLLARLGNFPARTLARERFTGPAGVSIGGYLQLEVVAREMENTITAASGAAALATDFQVELRERLATRTSLSVSAPTSAGKSFVLSAHVVERLRAASVERPESLVYVVPTRALLRQVLLKLVRDLADAGLGSVPVRSVPIPVAREGRPPAVVYVLTQERLATLLSHGGKDVFISGIVADEAHGIRDGARGIILQSAIEQVLARWPDASLFFASPLTANPGRLLDLFGRDSSGAVLLEEEGPVAQNIILVRGVTGHPRKAACEVLLDGAVLPLGERSLPFALSEGVLKRRAYFASAVTGENECTIVYANRPEDAERIARYIHEIAERSDAPDDAVEDLIEFLREEVHESYPLIDTLRAGVAYHYGFMPGIVRAYVEDLAAAGALRFICCTSTLLQGVNLPARHVVLENPSRGIGQPMQRADFLNLAGRAGRLLKEFHGNVWCLKPESWETQSFTGERLQEITSSFEEALRDGGTIIERALTAQTVERERDLADAVVGKVFSEFTLAQRSLVRSVYRTDLNETVLRRVEQALLSVRVALPPEVFVRNATLLPTKLETLRSELNEEADLESLLPLLPLEHGSNVRMEEIFERVHRVLGGVRNQSWRFFAWLASEWIHDTPLGTIFADRIRFVRGQGNSQRESRIILEVMKALEQDIRYRFVKYLRAYNDVLEAVLRDRQALDLVDRVRPLHLYLECGASSQVVLSLISIGLSRSTALRLKGQVRFSEGATPEDCIALLRSIDVSRLSIPALCRRELRQVLGQA